MEWCGTGGFDRRGAAMKSLPSQDNDEPIIVLVLFVLAGLCVLGGLFMALENPAAGLGAGLSSGAGMWAAAVLIRVLHKIERNTRR